MPEPPQAVPLHKRPMSGPAARWGAGLLLLVIVALVILGMTGNLGRSRSAAAPTPSRGGGAGSPDTMTTSASSAAAAATMTPSATPDAWYRVTAYNLDGIPGPPSAPYPSGLPATPSPP